MEIPELKPSGRDREYNNASFDEVSKIIKAWLFTDDQHHRYLDREVLGFDEKKTKGFRSMGILHYFGLKKEFKGIFIGKSIKDSIDTLKTNYQDFNKIIEYLEYTDNDKNHVSASIKILEKIGNKKHKDFNRIYKKKLSEIDNTDRISSSVSRNEQALLRAILFGKKEKFKCAFCQKELPVDIIVAAHIKPRTKCSLEEKTDPNIVMPACRLGCDELYEKGYIIINDSGKIIKNILKNFTRDLNKFVDQYEGKKCSYFNDKTHKYFKYKVSFLTKSDKEKKKEIKEIETLILPAKNLLAKKN